MRKRGFTLVELSIVLVIIGLFIGGILAAQSMVESAKINAFTRQMEQYEIASRNFKSKYNALAGESGLLNTINYTGSCALKTNKLTDEDCINNSSLGNVEIGLFWFDLVQLGGLEVKNCPGMKTASVASSPYPLIRGANCNMPEAELKKNVGILPAALDPVGSELGNAYYLMDCSATTSAFPLNCSAVLDQSQVLAYDTKVDDAKPNTGKILGAYYAGATIQNIMLNGYLSMYGSSYNLSSASKLVLIQNMQDY